MAIIGMKTMDEVVQRVKDEKVSIGVVAAVIWLAYYAHGWVFETFVTKATAAESVQSVQGTLNDVQKTLNAFVSTYEIREAKKNVELLETQLWHTEQHVREHGASPETSAKMTQLERKLDAAIKFRDCLLADRPNCEHLKG